MSFNHSELLDKSPLGIVLCDENQRITWCNQRFYKDTKLSEAQIINQLYISLPFETVDNDEQTVQLFNDKVTDTVKFRYWQEELDSPKNATAHYFAQEKIGNKRALTSTKLTGVKLSKRASWIEFLDYEISRSRRYGNPLSILKLHLLVFNKPETVTDSVLNQCIKDTLMDELRWADMIGNTDHGTYIMVLPETPEESLTQLQQKLSKALNRQLQLINEEMKYELVFGTANWRKHDDSQMLLKKARSRLVEKLEDLMPG